MRRSALLLLCFAAACAHGARPIRPDAWHELRSERFTLRTGLPLEDARRTVVDLEEVRRALLAAGWHAARMAPGRTQVIELESEREMQDYAVKGLAGFEYLESCTYEPLRDGEKPVRTEAHAGFRFDR